MSMNPEKTTIRRYLNKYLSDEFAMQILCYKLRSMAVGHNYTLSGVPYITIDQQYYPYQALIEIKGICSTQLDTFALLLSIRALILDHSLFNKCDDNHLLFTDLTIGYKWLDYFDIIQRLSYDEEFSNLYKILKELRETKRISSDSLTVFNQYTIDPGEGNKLSYYEHLADTLDKVNSGVIPKHYYLGNDDIQNYTITSSIKYIGSGAFAYCKNLKSITIKAKDVLFGPFAIIECDNLKEIIVPAESISYYKEALPFYKDIIVQEGAQPKVSRQEPEPESEQEPEPLPEPEPQESIPVVEVINGEIPESIVEVIAEEPIVPVFSAFDSSKLKNVFDSKTTTYKYFWYMSFLTIVNEKQTKSIPIIDMEIMMITKAWPYLCHYGLDFGSSDQIDKMIADIRKKTYLIENASEAVVNNQVNYHIDSLKGILAPLGKNVPFRFLSPWIKYTSDQEVMEASQQNNTATYALYEDKIVFDNERLKFFTEHYDEQLQFIKKSLKEYLGRYNNAFKMLKFMIK